MFHDMPAEMVAEMERLQAIDTQDRVDGTPHLQRLRQIPPETGKFLALLLANAPAGKIIEIGTSVGYSTLWLALACVTTGRTITTFEVLPEKVKLARATFATAGVEDVVTLIHDDARQHLADYKDVAFCFLDAEKDIYRDCYELVVPNMVAGGLFVADNAISHGQALQPVINQVLADERVDAMVAPVGKGLLLARKG
ncbi:MAG TPA: class I SAM-dependent methyltransferase [Anaerolineae bacterium]|jgi:predicted O-methyltransferase YrrM|nr:class I SAM-dependent methyltransferase [Anaerolineae bacterium]